MKDLTRAAELLAELRALADNDFELHRIDVLERDLTAPPVAEVIDETHQKFDGVVYRKCNDGHYFYTNSIYRAIWQYYHGDIPEGFEIHHSNFNKDDNSTDNLELKTKSEHRKIHIDARAQQTSTCIICGKVFVAPLGAKFCSANCQAKSKGIVRKCKHCGKDFTAYKKETQYCSNTCALLDKPAEEKICKQCGEKFLSSERSSVFCSRKCYMKYNYLHNRKTRTCPVCGKTFETYVYGKQKFCSRKCATKSRY